MRVHFPLLAQAHPHAFMFFPGSLRTASKCSKVGRDIFFPTLAQVLEEAEEDNKEQDEDELPPEVVPGVASAKPAEGMPAVLV